MGVKTFQSKEDMLDFLEKGKKGSSPLRPPPVRTIGVESDPPNELRTIEDVSPNVESLPEVELSPEEERAFAEALEAKDSYDSYEPLKFDDPVEMFLFMERMTGGKRTLYKWQAETLIFLSQKFRKEDPLRFYLQACNGSGKDAFIITLFAVWFVACKVRSRFIGTSASFTQLENQTEAYIRNYAAQINTALGYPFFLVKKQHIVCKKTGSEVQLFTTNDPGRAEGWHPFPDFEDAEMVICVNEAKTVDDEIFAHLKKCTGYNYWLEISSPGKPSGHFFHECKRAVEWPAPYDGRKYKRRVVAYDCPHISRKEIKDAIEEHGENNPWVRNTYFAEFSSVGENLVISPELYEKYITQLPDKIEATDELPLRCGIDIGGIGDEDTMYACRGNYLYKSKCFREADSIIKTQVIINTLVSWGFDSNRDAKNIFVDDGNVGHAIIDNLLHSGWEVNRVLNQSRPFNMKMYANRGAELWFNFRRLIEKSLFWLPYNLNISDNKLYGQLISRYYSQGGIYGKMQLESKADARSRGASSPDRADALILANAGLNATIIEGYMQGKVEGAKKKGHSVEGFPTVFDNFVFSGFQPKNRNERVKACSLASMFSIKGL